MKNIDIQQDITVAELVSKSSDKKKIVAVKVAGKLFDLQTKIQKNSDEVEFVLKDSVDALELIRHSCAHLLAHAVSKLYPEAQVTIGPVIEDGFYYDFYYPPGFNQDDLLAIEKLMYKLSKKNIPIKRYIKTREDAIEHFKNLKENYKVEIIESIPGNEELSFYEQDDFVDICRGPHVPHTGHIKYFKLTRVAGAYWRGDSNNVMLQRIYGTAWHSKQELDDYLNLQIELKKRDHRIIGPKLDYYEMLPEAPGMVFWQPYGWLLFRMLETFIRSQLEESYNEVKTPVLVDSSLWHRSGHIEAFKENMFFLSKDEREYALKPMNCPCHVLLFNKSTRSYKDLPIRFSEFGSCHRYEPSGAMHGLMRLRSFTQDDGHIFCMANQIQSEIKMFTNQLLDVYKKFGFNNIIVRIATRPDKRIGSDQIWDSAEDQLRSALSDLNISWQELPGEGAFYGPKIEFSLQDSLKRVWQCGTIQADFCLPDRLGARYINEQGEKEVPVMLHRAILGSLERFMAILIEQYNGALPFWLAPVQVVLVPVSGFQKDFVMRVEKILKKSQIRVEKDLRNEKIGYKIRHHTMRKIPFLLVVGQKEVDSNEVTIRRYGIDEQKTIGIDNLLDYLNGFKI